MIEIIAALMLLDPAAPPPLAHPTGPKYVTATTAFACTDVVRSITTRWTKGTSRFVTASSGGRPLPMADLDHVRQALDGYMSVGQIDPACTQDRTGSVVDQVAVEVWKGADHHIVLITFKREGGVEIRDPG